MNQRPARRVAAVTVLGACLIACLGPASPNRLAPPGEMPPNTIPLSQMMRELSAQPGFTEAMLAQLGQQSKVGAALLTPELVDRLRQMVLGKDWAGLDRFPGWTMRAINPTVRVVGHIAGKDEAINALSTNPGATPASRAAHAKAVSKAMSAFVDFGPYTLDQGHTEDLDRPSNRPPFSAEGLVNPLGHEVTRGDGPDPRLAPMHAESVRLAELLNRLSLNGFDQAGHVTPTMTATLRGHTAATPQDLVAALIATGHVVVVADARYFANFGHFHFRGQDVMMPFWVDTEIRVPGTTRSLLVPVSHAEYEWQIRGPVINASVSHYFGIDGKAEFRVMDQLDQPWVMDRHAHEYRGAQAIEATRLAGDIVMAYAHQHQARPRLPFGGYYALGVCQDVVAAIELKLTGKATLFPNTSDASLFTDPRDAEINELIRALPKDRAGLLPAPERIFGSLPTDDLEGVTVPGLGPDLVAVHRAWTNGTLKRLDSREHNRLLILLSFAGALVLLAVMRRALQRTKLGTR